MADRALKRQEVSIAQLQEEVAALRAELTSLRKDLKGPPHAYENIHHEDSTYSSESAPSGETLCTVVGTSPGSPLGLNPDPDPDPDPDESVKNGEETPTSALKTPKDDEDTDPGLDDRSGDFSTAQATQTDMSRPKVDVPLRASHSDIRSGLIGKLYLVKNSIRNTIVSYFWPPVPQGYERITWTCVSTGYSLQDHRF